MITGYIGLHGERKCENQAVPSMRKISKVRKELRNVGHLGQGLPEVTLKETKECFRRGVEKLPLQALAKWRVVHDDINYNDFRLEY